MNDNDTPTICAMCEHSYFKIDGPRTSVWYNHYCTKAPDDHLNFISGNIVKSFKSCRDQNNGKCEYFEKAAERNLKHGDKLKEAIFKSGYKCNDDFGFYEEYLNYIKRK